MVILAKYTETFTGKVFSNDEETVIQDADMNSIQNAITTLFQTVNEIGNNLEDVKLTIPTIKNELTDEMVTKLEGIEEGANNYTHPTWHEATEITETAERYFVTLEEKEKLSNLKILDVSWDGATGTLDISTQEGG